MEHLDLAGVINASTAHWTMPAAFEQQDAIYLSSSRQMLEPILEETSEDEERAQNSWNQYENATNFWSSAESETGSVIRIELTKDPDSISERDFACPAKRARRGDEFLIGGPTMSLHCQPSGDNCDDTVVLRRYQRTVGPATDYALDAHNSLERFLAYEAGTRDSYTGQTLQPPSLQRSSTGSRRFDEFYSDADSLSYQSLSRSSSLIQFESLERQLLLQEQHASMTSLGNSSPSLLSFDGASSSTEDASNSGGAGRNSGTNSGNSSRRGSQSSLLKRFESSDGRLHQTYFDLDKLNFDDDQQRAVLFGAGSAGALGLSKSGNLLLESTMGDVKSDTESSSSSTGSSSGNSILTASKPSTEDLSDTGRALNGDCSAKAGMRYQQSSGFARAGKNSVENLSEDSGYCEPPFSTLRRSKSKRIPSSFDDFCEEDEEFQQHDECNSMATAANVEAAATTASLDNSQNTIRHSKNSNINHGAASVSTPIASGQPKINVATFNAESPATASATREAPHTPSLSPPHPIVSVAALPATYATPPYSTPSTAPTATTGSPHSQYYERLKNSPTREQQRQRSLAHSPSPVSSDASSSSGLSGADGGGDSSATSASTCASAASFTWLPLALQHQQRQQHHEQQARNQRESLGKFCPLLRNSLPDIRDAFSSDTADVEEFSSVAPPLLSTDSDNDFNNHDAKAFRIANNALEQAACSRRFGSDAVEATRSSAATTSSDATTTDAETPTTRRRCSSLAVGVVNSAGSASSYGQRARISSVPNELDKLGRRKRATKTKNSKASRHDASAAAVAAFGSSEEGEDDFFADCSLKIRRSGSWSERRAHNWPRLDETRHRTGCTKSEEAAADADDDADSSEEERRLDALARGFMNASYHDLTLLDYSGRRRTEQRGSQQASHKRNSVADNDMEKKQRASSSGDYESIVCKGNFLLDELSELYDKNASILNDKTMDALDGEQAVFATTVKASAMEPPEQPRALPKPPPRRRTPNSSHSDLEASGNEDYGDEVQHVQLTIRQPPARQKHGRGEGATNSLLVEEVSVTTPGKTFDQDPTNLRTSYAQSLEKCNFDPKELSNTDLSKVRAIPKRRFQTQAATTAKKNLVSSTPNLNAYDPRADEIEDDMYVCSAHTSMHTLPQGSGQKPLGILLPAGSRTSFGKEVSFCPVVSKYCWQEQSSEECTESALARAQGEQGASMTDVVDDSVVQEESSDDELLDNADATVIQNTRANETIAARYNAEQQEQSPLPTTVEEQNVLLVTALRVQPAAVESVREILIVQENGVAKSAQNIAAESGVKERQLETTMERQTQSVNDNNKSSTVGASSRLSLETTLSKRKPLETTINGAGAIYDVPQTRTVKPCASEPITTSAGAAAIAGAARPLSIQLPILSEPPTNRAHHILYASQQMLDNLQRREAIERERERIGINSVEDAVGDSSSGMEDALDKASCHTFLNSGTQKNTYNGMYYYNDDGSIVELPPQKQITASNNNNNAQMKSKFKADEKHPSSKGFLSRFANGFRFSLRRNKKKQKEQQAQHLQQTLQQQSLTAGDKPPKQQQQTSNAVIHIPLKGPLPGSRPISSSKTPAVVVVAPVPKPLTNGSAHNISNSSHDSQASTASVQSGSNGVVVVGGAVAEPGQKVTLTAIRVTGKPPLPPQSAAHAHYQQYPQQQQQQLEHAAAANFNASRNQSHNNNTTSSPKQQQAQTTDATFLEAERSYYAGYDDFKAQLQSGMQANCCVDGINNVGNSADESDSSGALAAPANGMLRHPVAASSPARSSVAAVRTPLQQQQHQQQHNQTTTNATRIGLLETNLDTHETIITGKTRSLMDIGPQQQQLSSFKRARPAGLNGGDADDEDDDADEHQDVYVVDMVDNNGMRIDGGVLVQRKSVGGGTSSSVGGGAAQIASVRRPHKSMEFLLDKENQKNVLPPENELQKSHDHNPAALSEHQLRVQASLQRLNIPDWFRQYNQGNSRSPDGGPLPLSTYKPGAFTRKRTNESGRWQGLNSKTTSLSSLGSHRSDRSPLLLSPSAHSHQGVQGNAVANQHHTLHASGSAGTAGGGAAGFSRWSTSHLNSSQTSPSVSQRGSFSRGGPVNSSFMSVASGQTGVGGSTIRSSFRQPYLGWRSTEKLSQRTPHERLATSLLAQQQRTSPTQRTANGGIGLQPQPVTPEIQSSIKEVTSAIVHYVNDQTQQQRSRSTSPNSRKCWLESSFVGIRPLDSPQTPVIDGANSFTAAAAANHLQLTPNATNNNNSNLHNYNSCTASSGIEAGPGGRAVVATSVAPNAEVLRMNGLSLSSGAPERSLSNASLEDVLASLLGLPSNTSANAAVAASVSDAYARSTTGASASELIANRHMPQQVQHTTLQQSQQQLQVNLAEQQRLRRRSEGDAPTQKQKQHQQQQQQQQQQNATAIANAVAGGAVSGIATTTTTPATTTTTTATIHSNSVPAARRVSLGDSSESNNKTASAELLQIKCRNTKCDRSATTMDAKKYYKSCHNCTHLYCSRECRRIAWPGHRKACLHSRASNLCRQVLATCKDDLDSQRHLSLLARKGFLSQGRGVVRALFRSADRAESFVKHGFQCMGEASYVRWPDLMPAEMGLELYSELLKLSTEYKPDSKMLIYVAICVVSEAPGMGQAPVRWERQLVSRCAKLKLCKTILAELELQQQALQQQPVAVVAVPEPTTEILILTFNPSLRTSAAQGEVILSNILDILSRRGVLLRKHYPEIYQRLLSYTEGQTDKFNPVTMHPRDSQTGQSFVCIIMPVHTDSEIIRLPSAADGGNRVTTIDVGSPAALAELDDDELLTRSTS